jgi:hypothetical protein
MKGRAGQCDCEIPDHRMCRACKRPGRLISVDRAELLTDTGLVALVCLRAACGSRERVQLPVLSLTPLRELRDLWTLAQVMWCSAPGSCRARSDRSVDTWLCGLAPICSVAPLLQVYVPGWSLRVTQRGYECTTGEAWFHTYAPVGVDIRPEEWTLLDERLHPATDLMWFRFDRRNA